MRRKTLDFVKERFGAADIVGAEVGVSTGWNALNILQNMPNVRLLYLVDPYLENMEYGLHKQPAKSRLAAFNNRTCWVYKKFENCTVKDVPEPLDFVYIDGDHHYKHVRKDIALARVFVKKGGVVGGHDMGALGVDRAVKELGIPFAVAGNEPYKDYERKKMQGWDWWLIND
ncbi:unnamed protein product [marine sediment metagenome]|uniref:Methyltransferase domain-containing protein n=1 Tax=marine sediment metagenome TaxID=412755 RepID=X1MB05_9ZZZZ